MLLWLICFKLDLPQAELTYYTTSLTYYDPTTVNICFKPDLLQAGLTYYITSLTY